MRRGSKNAGGASRWREGTAIERQARDQSGPTPSDEACCRWKGGGACLGNPRAGTTAPERDRNTAGPPHGDRAGRLSFPKYDRSSATRPVPPHRDKNRRAGPPHNRDSARRLVQDAPRSRWPVQTRAESRGYTARTGPSTSPFAAGGSRVMTGRQLATTNRLVIYFVTVPSPALVGATEGTLVIT